MQWQAKSLGHTASILYGEVLHNCWNEEYVYRNTPVFSPLYPQVKNARSKSMQRVEFSRPLKRRLCLTALLVRGDTRSHFSITVTSGAQLSNCELSPQTRLHNVLCDVERRRGCLEKIIWQTPSLRRKLGNTFSVLDINKIQLLWSQ